MKAVDKSKTGRVYSYETPESRVMTAEWLFEQAKNERTAKEQEWIIHNNYYNFLHETQKSVAEYCESAGIPYIPAVVPDPFIQVESQISPDVPMPEFHGRDEKDDDKKAKKREMAVKYVLENNDINSMNTANERRLRKYGDAFWKAFWDADMPFMSYKGDIRIKDISVEDLYFDPVAKNIDECEYVAYVYTLHKNEFRRRYHKELKKMGLTVDDLVNTQYRPEDELLGPYTTGTRCRDDLIQVCEFWFKQPEDGKDFEAGDIACTIQAGGHELKYIPRYWKNTGAQCKLYPFIHYWCINDETQFYNKSELEPILSMVDAADRELAAGLLNNAMTGNDIIIVDESALKTGTVISNEPGAVIQVKQGKMDGIRRLGGLHGALNSTPMVDWLQNQIQRASRNYDINQGQETTRVTTASGLLQMRADASSQQQLKKADRKNGFKRLFELIDWLCLEFYDDARMLHIGAVKNGEEAQNFIYDRLNLVEHYPAVVDSVTQEVLMPERDYYPRLDVTVTTGEGLTKNPATTLEVLDKLAAIQITADNYKLLSAELDYLDIPQKNEIKESWKKKFEAQEMAQEMGLQTQQPQMPSVGMGMDASAPESNIAI